jgi:hypothetical protein
MGWVTAASVAQLQPTLTNGASRVSTFYQQKRKSQESTNSPASFLGPPGLGDPSIFLARWAQVPHGFGHLPWSSAATAAQSRLCHVTPDSPLDPSGALQSEGSPCPLPLPIISPPSNAPPLRTAGLMEHDCRLMFPFTSYPFLSFPGPIKGGKGVGIVLDFHFLLWLHSVTSVAPHHRSSNHHHPSSSSLASLRRHTVVSCPR